MTRNIAFFSYTRADDRASNGVLSKVRALLEDRVHVKYGRRLSIFQDTDDIKFGDNWQKKLDVALQESNYLLPVITPSFFNSGPCRDELSKFLEKSKALGRDDLVIPILFLNTPALGNVEQRSRDKLAAAINQSQWADWRIHEDKISVDQSFYTDVNRLAQRLVEKIIDDDALSEAQKSKPKTFNAPASEIKGVAATLPDFVASDNFAIGDRVFHPKFGFGAVEQIDNDKLSVAFEKIGTKKIVAAYVEKSGKANGTDEVPF